MVKTHIRRIFNSISRQCYDVHKMRKLFFVLSSMNVGGVEKAFLGLLSTMSLEENEVHIGLIHKNGYLLNQLPKEVHIHEISVYQKYERFINAPIRSNIKALLRERRLWEAFVQLMLEVHFRLTGTRYWFYRHILRNEPMMDEAFDVAVAFAGPSQMIDYFICNKVCAKEKYGWIHFDISRYGIDAGLTAKLYKNYEKIFVVSEEARQIFVKRFPQFAEKTEVRYNVVSKDQIVRMAGVGPTFADDYQGCRLLTVGRISPEKGQMLAIETLMLLKDRGYDVRWYFVGDGKDLRCCKSRAMELGLKDDAVFLGLQTNPYRFMRDCDIYVQPSFHEGFCITLAEALCFDKPIVTTNFTGAKEQLKNWHDSVISDINAKSLADGIEHLLLVVEQVFRYNRAEGYLRL